MCNITALHSNAVVIVWIIRRLYLFPITILDVSKEYVKHNVYQYYIPFHLRYTLTLWSFYRYLLQCLLVHFAQKTVQAPKSLYKQLAIEHRQDNGGIYKF